MDINKTIGNKLKQIRKSRLRINQQTAAKKLHISYEAYQRLERGVTGITVGHLVEIYKAFKIPVSDLLPDELFGDNRIAITNCDPIVLIETALALLKNK